ncbi:unnamed protein product [Orchesella dallaii]|uniref:Phospholipid scramblase n=1 Tax=Orchesella dallaii TaxID=48710 RepID=A0ABP1PL73_9HEXA
MSSTENKESKVYKSVITTNKISVAPITIITPEDVSVPGCSKTQNRNGSPLINFVAGSMTMIPKTPETICEIKESEQTLSEDLTALKGKESVFIYQVSQAIEKFVNVPNKYEIQDSNGHKIYSVIETTDGITRRLFRRDQPFKLKILNFHGEIMLDLIGDPGIRGLGAFVKLQRNATVLGKVVQVSPLFACCNFSPSYNVTTDKGKPVYRIEWPKGRLKSCVFTNDFQIYSVEKKRVPVGKVCRQNNMDSSFFEEMNTSDGDKYALIFHDSEMDSTDKALLIAAVIMLDFQFFEGREGSHVKKFCIAVAVLVILLFLIAVLVLCLI